MSELQYLSMASLAVSGVKALKPMPPPLSNAPQMSSWVLSGVLVVWTQSARMVPPVANHVVSY